jgi:hypothetical protein
MVHGVGAPPHMYAMDVHSSTVILRDTAAVHRRLHSCEDLCSVHAVDVRHDSDSARLVTCVLS